MQGIGLSIESIVLGQSVVTLQCQVRVQLHYMQCQAVECSSIIVLGWSIVALQCQVRVQLHYMQCQVRVQQQHYGVRLGVYVESIQSGSQYVNPCLLQVTAGKNTLRAVPYHAFSIVFYNFITQKAYWRIQRRGKPTGPIFLRVHVLQNF